MSRISCSSCHSTAIAAGGAGQGHSGASSGAVLDELGILSLLSHVGS